MFNRKRCVKIISFALFLVYLVVLIYFVLFAEMWGRSVVSAEYSYNLVPFREILRFAGNIEILGWTVVMINLAGNVIAFVPFGLFLPIITRSGLNLWTTALLTFDLSLAIELMQLVTKVGCFDVDDLILNTIGGMIGYFLCWFWDRYERKRSNGIL